MASRFFPGCFGSQKIRASPLMIRCVAGPTTSDGRGPGSESRVTPGFKTASLAICAIEGSCTGNRHPATGIRHPATGNEQPATNNRIPDPGSRIPGLQSLMRSTSFVLAFALASLSITAPSAQEKIDRDINWKIRREATDSSQIMRTLHFLTDVYGPRLTGSPNLKAAQDWVVAETSKWGLKNAHLEPWSFGHPGWLNEKLSVHVVSPVKDALVVEALAWTPGTNGAVTAPTVQLQLPERPTKDVLTKFLEASR